MGKKTLQGFSFHFFLLFNQQHSDDQMLQKHLSLSEQDETLTWFSTLVSTMPPIVLYHSAGRRLVQGSDLLHPNGLNYHSLRHVVGTHHSIPKSSPSIKYANAHFYQHSGHHQGPSFYHFLFEVTSGLFYGIYSYKLILQDQSEGAFQMCNYNMPLLYLMLLKIFPLLLGQRGKFSVQPL